MANSFLEERETPEYDSLMSLAEQIVLRLPGCDDEMVRKTISSLYRDFVKRGCIFFSRQEIELDNHEEGCYISPLRMDCIVDSVVRVLFNGVELSKYRYLYCGGGRIRFDCSYPLPGLNNSKDVVVVEFLEIPKIGAERAPSEFIHQYGDAIISGVLWKLMAMQGKPWSDGQQAAMYAVEYENALTENRMSYYGNSAGSANYFKKGLLL